MTAPGIKGWCPGALRPMQSGDGLVVRIRPPMGRLTPAQAKAIAGAGVTHGNGTIDLSARANLQLRGVTTASHGLLIDDLRLHDLIDPDIETESLRNLIVTPFRSAPATPAWSGDGGVGPLSDADGFAATVTAALAHMPRLPAKFGFAIDTGPRPVLSGASADIRVERSDNGRLILRPDGHPFGQPVTDLARDAITLVNWFVANGGITLDRGRMAALVARGTVPPGCSLAPARPLAAPTPGVHPEGAFVALAFGQMHAETLFALASLGHEIRPTPWRMLMLVGATAVPAIPGIITDPADPVLRITACTGALGCPQARGETRTLARSLAEKLPDGCHLHVSGCAKGCAHPGASDLTLVATAPDRYDLVIGGTARDTPARKGLHPAAIPDHLKAPHAPSL